MRGICKCFGAVQALRRVHLKLYPSEVLGLVGDNAAGKSTLMKVLSGAYRPDAGEILIDGRVASITKPEDSRRLGIEMVYQDFALVNNLDVAGNIFLGREALRFKFGPFQVMNKALMERQAQHLLERLRIDVAPVGAKVEALSGGQRQAVAIARATAFNARIIIMDEPTAAMSVAAIDKVIELIRRLKTAGASIIIISHRLEDIFHVGDRVVVLRHGQKAGELPVGSNLHLFRERVVACMIGARSETTRLNDEIN